MKVELGNPFCISGLDHSKAFTRANWRPHWRQKPTRTCQLPISGQAGGGNAMLKKSHWNSLNSSQNAAKPFYHHHHCLFHRHSQWAILLPFPNIVQFSVSSSFFFTTEHNEKTAKIYQQNNSSTRKTTIWSNQAVLLLFSVLANDLYHILHNTEQNQLYL